MAATLATAGVVLAMSPVISSAEAAPSVVRRPGPAGSLVLVESNNSLPIVRLEAALRTGAASDPRKKEGLANFAFETARRGAAGRAREEIDARLDGLGATLEVATHADSVRLVGTVLARNLDAYLGVVADVLLRPDFPDAEISRTRREILSDIDELRTDDEALGNRFFTRNLYGEHPYGHPPEGTAASLGRISRDDLVAYHRKHVVGPNVVFAASGAVAADQLAELIKRNFASLRGDAAPGVNPLAVRRPVPPQGWRIQLVDKPNRQQAHIFFGHIGVPASDPSYLPLLVAATAFGGPGMKTTLMEEVRTKRGLAYGAYLSVQQRLGHGSVVGWVSSSADKAVATMKLVLKLYVELQERGLSRQRIDLAKSFLAGSYAAQMDDPERRLDARVTAEIAGLPPTFVDELPARARQVGADDVNRTIRKAVKARDMAITVVGTAPVLERRLIASKVEPGAIDVVAYDSY